MRRLEIDARATTTADPATVYTLLRDGASWPTWSPIGTFELEQGGDTEREGLGAIRVFRTKQAIGEIASRERIVELTLNRRFSYQLVSGLPLRDYRADIDLEPTESGTAIRWHSTFYPKIVGTGWLYRRTLAAFIDRCVRGLAEQAASAAPQPPSSPANPAQSTATRSKPSATD